LFKAYNFERPLIVC